MIGEHAAGGLVALADASTSGSLGTAAALRALLPRAGVVDCRRRVPPWRRELTPPARARLAADSDTVRPCEPL